jgi:CDGSH-type Zn-finger protein
MHEMEEVVIKILANGPLLVHGKIRLVDAEGNEFDLGGRGKTALCRCGQSANKPLCDGSHGRCSFAANDTARVL